MTCCVPGCRTGYRSSKEKASLFSLPSNREQRDMWKRAIPRQEAGAFSFESKNVRVCAKHFDPTDVIRADGFVIRGQFVSLQRDKVRLRAEAIPRIFENLPAYLTKPKARSRSQRVKPAAKPRLVSSGATVNYRETCDTDAAVDYADANVSMPPQKRLKKTAAPSKRIPARTRDCKGPARRRASSKRASRSAVRPAARPASARGTKLQAGLEATPQPEVPSPKHVTDQDNSCPARSQDAAETLLPLCASIAASQERSALAEQFWLGKSCSQPVHGGLQARHLEASALRTASLIVPALASHAGVDRVSRSQEAQVGILATHRGVQCALVSSCDAGCQTISPGGKFILFAWKF